MSDIDPTAAWDARDEVFFLDVREQPEWDAGHIDGAVHVPMQRIRLATDELPQDRRIVAVCRSGARSAAVTSALREAGYDVANLVGGMHAWEAADLPFTTDDGSPPRVA